MVDGEDRSGAVSTVVDGIPVLPPGHSIDAIDRVEVAYATSAASPPVTASSSAKFVGNTACANCSI
jgi:hypothetical protein